MRELWRDIDKIQPQGLHMNWTECVCSDCSTRRVLWALREAQAAIARVEAYCEDSSLWRDITVAGVLAALRGDHA